MIDCFLEASWALAALQEPDSVKLSRDSRKWAGGGPLLSSPGLHSGVPRAVHLSGPSVLVLTQGMPRASVILSLFKDTVMTQEMPP